MSSPLTPLNRQVVVITGASSGIGLASAQEAGKQGAKPVLAARGADVLDAGLRTEAAFAPGRPA